MKSPVSAPASWASGNQTERAILAIRGMLLRGDFESGERISELPLAARLERADIRISRTPLRRALDHLAHEGLLRAWPTGGYVVCAFALEDIWDAIDLRGVLEGTAARLAAERLENDDELEGLRELSTQLDALNTLDEVCFPRYLNLNKAFHEEIWRLSKSPMLLRAIEQVVNLPFAAPSALVFGPTESAAMNLTASIAREQHRSLIDAIGNREGMRAEGLAREHSRIARKNLARALEDRNLAQRVPGVSLIQIKFAG